MSMSEWVFRVEDTGGASGTIFYCGAYQRCNTTLRGRSRDLHLLLDCTRDIGVPFVRRVFRGGVFPKWEGASSLQVSRPR